MVKVKETNGNLIVYLKGRLDVHLSGEIEKDLNQLIEKKPDKDLIINLLDIEYMSSSGLRVLVAIMRLLKGNNKNLKLCHLNSAVRKIFEVVELMDMFDIYETEEEALKS
ncbi:MAG: STAS domain-containing protein [Leptospiraceae bacterium]|nr:STAS domain-containing protein [Leptospiraceae bacterium]MCB1200176.1 STAS domain-containing protein [Leptospiraceae bacterium]